MHLAVGEGDVAFIYLNSCLSYVSFIYSFVVHLAVGEGDVFDAFAFCKVDAAHKF